MSIDNEKTTREKLAILLPHLVSHNSEHAVELEKWANLAERDGDTNIGEELRHAAKHLKKSSDRLGVAVSLLLGQKPTTPDRDKSIGGWSLMHNHDHLHKHDEHHDDHQPLTRTHRKTP